MHSFYTYFYVCVRVYSENQKIVELASLFYLFMISNWTLNTKDDMYSSFSGSQ